LVHEIRINLEGFAFVYIDIKPNNSLTMERVRYKVDTGANCTTISKKRLSELGYDENWIKSGALLKGADRPTAATGLPINDCYVVKLPEIRIGEWVGYNWPFMTCLSVPFNYAIF
jgi:hypothetical protein